MQTLQDSKKEEKRKALIAKHKLALYVDIGKSLKIPAFAKTDYAKWNLK